ncbi:hypothetical protein [Burkholderia gladioli]|uniref:hypothetical protein n=1 Tax=Burkholderia gladioli TaxID=28095 RepID=UPI001641C07E|nr:hypothetical protein [Burkholderia gladioli]
MTLSELRKRLREDTLSPPALVINSKNVHSPLAIAINSIATGRGTIGARLHLPSEIVPLLP